MRLEFIKGKQRELIKSYKKQHNLTWLKLAQFCGVKIGRLNSYVYEYCLIPAGIYEKLDPENKYNKFILEKKDEQWGRKKGGINSNGSTKNIIIPNESKELAEFYGIMLGDGNSNKTKYYKTRYNKRGTYRIRIVGDSRYDKDYLLDYVKPLIEKLFKINVKYKFEKNRNALFLESYSVQLVNFLESIGFSPGNKIKNKLRIPFWIRNNKEYLKACIRGLYDTDGSVYKLKNQNTHQINFSNYNIGLLKDVRNSLLEFGINCSKINQGKRIDVTKKSELRKFLKLIGFSNSKHLNKIKMWKLNSPLV